LLSRAFKRQFVIPEFHRFCKKIDTMFEHCKDNTDGMVNSGKANKRGRLRAIQLISLIRRLV
jgi:hypothetical protein